MKINSINNAYITNKNINKSFKATAVPYPEYKAAYIVSCKKAGAVEKLVDKIAEFFSPKVTKEAKNIQKTIDFAFEEAAKNVKPNRTSRSAQQALLSVLA